MGGWLAGLDAFVVGLGYLVALLATRFVVRPLLLAVLSSAPVIGGWLAANVDAGIGAFERAITPAANASMGTVISALDWLVAQVRGALAEVSNLANSAYAAAYQVLHVSLPHALAQNLQQIENLVAAARGEAQGLYQVAEHDIATSFGLAEADAQALVSVTEGALRSEISAAEGIVLQEIRKVEQTTGQLFQQAEYDAAQATAHYVTIAEQLVIQARQDLGAAVGAVEHDLQLLAEAERVALQDSVSTLGGDISAAEGRAQAALGSLEESVKAEIEKVLASGPWSGLVAEYGIGEELLKQNVLALVLPAAKAIRAQLADVDALRARYGPEIAKAGVALRA